MRLAIYLFALTFVVGCTSSKKSIGLVIQKQQLTISNWKPSNSTLHKEEVVQIYVWDKKEDKKTKTLITGQLKYGNHQVISFIPDFPFVENTHYIIRINDDKLSWEKVFSLPNEYNNSLEILSIYPTSDELPENLLRMYIHFSQPMKTVGNIEKIKLIDEDGVEIQGAIFNNVYELWDSKQQQLTVIFDPSRVKTGLQANVEMGRALKAGKSYSLIIEDAENIYGQRLATSYKKTFKVIEEDYNMPNVENWKYNIPVEGRQTPFIIDFSEPLDWLSLHARIKVFDFLQREVKGNIAINNNELEWNFTPTEKWKSGEYTIKVNTRLEDPSGNNLNGLFDHKTGSLISQNEGETISIPFKVN
jgi:hypothetical protein